MANRSYVAYRMDRRRIIALAVGAVVVAVALAVAVNVATNPWTLAWARTGAWVVAGAAAVIGLGLAVWQRVWHRSDARRQAENGVTAVRQTLLEEVLSAERIEPPSLTRLLLLRDDELVAPLGFQLHAPRPLPGKFGTASDVDSWFDRAGGSLLVCGETGTGKSHLLAYLAGQVAERARQDPERPVPVALHLASWGIGGRTLQSWVGEELRRRYAVGLESALDILRPGRSFLLLDGLDELPPRERVGCVREINSFVAQQPATRMVVACRTLEYLEFPLRLQFTAAVVAYSPEREDAQLAAIVADGDEDYERALAADRQRSRRTDRGDREDREIGLRQPGGEGAEAAPPVPPPGPDETAPPDEDEDKPATGEFPPLTPPDEPPSDPAGLPTPPAPREAAAPAASDTRLVVLEQAVLSVLDPQVGQDEVQIASAARITPGETARTLQRLEERGLIVPTRPRQTGTQIVRRYLKR